MKIPRDYQNDAHVALWDWLHDPANRGKNPLVVEATGLGKSLNIAMFCTHMLKTYPSVRIMQATHVKELVGGNYEELMAFWPAAPAGVYSSGLKIRDTEAQITFCGIASVAKRAATFGRIDFLVIDEAHRLDGSARGMYGKLIGALRKVNPNMIVIGFTATPYRMGQGLLTDGELFDEIVYDIGSGESFVWAVENGYLILPVPTDTGIKLDDSGIGITGGDFRSDEASNALHEQDIIEEAVDYTIQIAREEGRRCNLTFAQSIDDAELIADMFTYKGFHTEAVHSKRSDRDDVLEEFKKGDLWGITNKDVLTTGFNNPNIDLMTVLRLTRSPALWVQMVGRTTRPSWGGEYYFGLRSEPPVDEQGRFNLGVAEGRLASIMASHKHNARVLDFCGNTERLGPINYPNLPRRRGKGAGEPPVRTCQLGLNKTEEGETSEVGCEPGTYHHTSVKVCPHCGYEWPKSTNLKTKASEANLVSETNPLGLPTPEKVEKEFEIYGVHEMVCTHHAGKNGKLDTLRVDYRCGYQRFSKWVGILHPRDKWFGREAVKWWEQHGGQAPVPTTIEDAVERSDELKLPKFIKVWVNTRFPEITAFDFRGTKFNEEFSLEPELHEPEPDPIRDLSPSYDTGYEYDDEIPF